jgi:hypothetical protein
MVHPVSFVCSKPSRVYLSHQRCISKASPMASIRRRPPGASSFTQWRAVVERTCAGLEAARCAGRVGGRKRRMTDSKVQAARKLLVTGTPPHEVAHSIGVSVPTLYRWVPASSRM